jgi:rhodanese-related sulfurtransferase
VELYRALDSGSAAVFDVRSVGEFLAAHLAGAGNLPLGELEERIAEIPKDKPVILYCGTARRALFSAVLLKEKGVRVSYVKGKFVVKDGKPQIIEQ